MRWTRALITGASSGIGLSMARLLASEGTALVVVARDEERLRALADELAVDVEVLPADLSDPAAVTRVADRIAADPLIDLVVNNAGFGTEGSIVDVDVESQQRMVAVNVSALLHLSQAAAKAFASRRVGAILNVSSVASFMSAPTSATYNATKAFVTSFSESLQAEMKEHGVTVTAVCPGLTRTEFQERADIELPDLPDFVWQSADEVAAAGLDAADKGKVVHITGAHNRAAVGGLKAMPGPLRRRVTARVARN